MKPVNYTLGGCWLVLALTGSLAAAAIVIEGGAPAPPQSNNPGIVVPAPNSGERTPTDTLEFLNGDVLHGRFVSIDAKTGARWRHPAMKQPFDVDLASIAAIKLDRVQPAGRSNATQTCQVRLSNGDQLYGELASMDATNLLLNTWYGGTLTIPRKMILSIIPGKGASSLVYAGPTGMEGWTGRSSRFIVQPGGRVARSGEAWTYSNKAFVTTGAGAIGRSFNFPPMVNIEFDLAWTGYLQLAVSLFADSVESPSSGNAYTLQFSQGNIYLQRVSRAGDSSVLGNTEIRDLAQKKKVHVSIRVNRDQKSIALVVDGALIKEWKENGTFFEGRNLVFHQQGRAGRTRLSEIKISTWDGKFESPDNPQSKTTQDFVRLSNNDKISGTLKSIQNGKMSFQTSFALLEVPLERIKEIVFAGAKTVNPAPAPGEVRLSFLDQGSLSFRLEHWDDQQITGSSPVLGQVKLKPSAFGEIQFNAGQTKSETEDGAMGGLGPDEMIIDRD